MSQLILDDFEAVREINPVSTQTALSPLLEQGEALLWASQPKQGIFRQMWSGEMLLMGFVLMLLPISVLWSWLSLILMGGSVSLDFWITVPLSLLFLGLGLYTAVGQYLMQAYQRKKTYIGVTATALLIQRPDLSQRIPLHQVLQARVELQKDDVGHLNFKYPLHQLPGTQQTFSKGITLEWVPGAERLLSILAEAQKEQIG